MYHDLLVIIKNAGHARKEICIAPFSKMDLEIAKTLVAAGYLADAKKRSLGRKQFLELKLAYDRGISRIGNVKFFSTPGRRTYAGYREVAGRKYCHGLTVLSTSVGILTAEEARKRRVGGALLFKVW